MLLLSLVVCTFGAVARTRCVHCCKAASMLLVDCWCEQIVKLKQIEHVIYEKRVLYSMSFPFCVRSEFTFKVTSIYSLYTVSQNRSHYTLSYL